MENDNLIDISSCIICMETNMDEIIFDCNHTICLNCYQKMLSMNNTIYCPICRKIVDEEIVKFDIIEPRQSTLCYRILTSTWFALLIFFILLGGLTMFFINPMKRN
jgi:hypothetical protein